MSTHGSAERLRLLALLLLVFAAAGCFEFSSLPGDGGVEDLAGADLAVGDDALSLPDFSNVDLPPATFSSPDAGISAAAIAFNGVWAGGTTVVIVGENQTIYYSNDHGDHFAIATVSGGTPDTLWAVAGVGGSLYAAGDVKQIYKSTNQGANWTSINGMGPDHLYAIWASGPNDIYVVGGVPNTSTVILHSSDGNSFSDDSGVPALARDLRAVWGSGPTDLWACGQLNTVLHKTTGNWDQVVGPGPGLPLYAMWGSAVGQPMLTATDKVFLRVGGGWVSVPVSLGNDFYGLWTAGARVYVVGNNGTVEQSGNGGASFNKSSPTTHTLLSVFSDGTDAWALGEGGTVLRGR